MGAVQKCVNLVDLKKMQKNEYLPAEPAFTCGDDNNSTNSTNTSGFGLGVFPAGGGPGSRVGGFGLGVFPAGGGSAGSASGVGGFGLGIFRDFSRYAINLYRDSSCTTQMYIGIPVVPFKFI